MPNVVIPPWLNLDPIAPARIALQAAGERNRAAAAERAAAAREQEIALHYQVEQAKLAEQERISYRRQLMADQLAQMEAQRRAEEVQLRRELHARQATQFQQSIKLREQAAERAAAEASIQAEGSRGLQQDLDAGMPIEQALPRHAGKLFYRHPERLAPALRGVAPPGAPQPGWTPSGQEYMTDARGGVHFPPRMAERNSASIRLSSLKAQLASIKGDIEEADAKELPRLKAKRDSIMKELEGLGVPPRSAGKIDESDAYPEDEEILGDEVMQEGVGDEGEE